jgi:hypothetical protein
MARFGRQVESVVHSWACRFSAHLSIDFWFSSGAKCLLIVAAAMSRSLVASSKATVSRLLLTLNLVPQVQLNNASRLRPWPVTFPFTVNHIRDMRRMEQRVKFEHFIDM